MQDDAGSIRILIERKKSRVGPAEEKQRDVPQKWTHHAEMTTWDGHSRHMQIQDYPAYAGISSRRAATVYTSYTIKLGCYSNSFRFAIPHKIISNWIKERTGGRGREGAADASTRYARWKLRQEPRSCHAAGEITSDYNCIPATWLSLNGLHYKNIHTHILHCIFLRDRGLPREDGRRGPSSAPIDPNPGTWLWNIMFRTSAQIR